MKKSMILGLFFGFFSCGFVQASFGGPVTNEEWAALAEKPKRSRRTRDTSGDDAFITYLIAKVKGGQQNTTLQQLFANK